MIDISRIKQVRYEYGSDLGKATKKSLESIF